MKLETIKCYHCNNSHYDAYANENGFTLVKCSECGLLYVNPCPSGEDISEGAKTGDHKGEVSFNMVGKYSRSKIKKYLKILDLIYSNGDYFKKNLSWLDIGAGHGEFLKSLIVLTNNGGKFDGLEPNTLKRLSAKKNGIAIQYEGIGEIINKYDCISILNVYSHLPNPVETLSQWKQLLKPHGEILIETGDTADLSLNDHPKPFLLPDHLSFASEKIVVNILEKLGFEIISVHKFRSPVYPKLTPIAVARVIYSRLKGSYVKGVRFFPKYPNIDMWIRARLK